MYVIGIYLVLSILLGAVMTVLNSILDTLKVGDAIRKLPIIGANFTIIISVVMVWVAKAAPIEGWGVAFEDDWMTYVVNGFIVCGMTPVKDAVVNAINKGLRA